MGKKFKFVHAHNALRISERKRCIPGELMGEFIRAFDEILSAQEVLATKANKKRLRYFRPMLDTLHSVQRDVIRRTKALRKAAPSKSELTKFEAILRQSFLLNEIVALESILNSPSNLVSDDEKQQKAEKTTDSIKKLIKKGNSWWQPEWFEDIFDFLLDVLDEILDILRGGTGNQPS